MRRYNDEEYRYYSERQPRYDRQPVQRTRPRKKKKGNTGLKVLGCITLLIAVVTCCFFSIAAFQKSKVVQTNVGPEVITTSQTLKTESSGGVMLTDVSDVVDQAMPSVVAITSRAYVNNYGYMDIWDYIMNQGYGSTPGYGSGQGYGSYQGYGSNQGYGMGQNMQGQGEEVDSGTGSGTIVGINDDELLILTSYHVVDGCSSLYVTFTNETSVDGYIKSAAENEDIAVVAVPLSEIPDETMQAISVAKLCTDGVDVGDGIIVIGNALGYGQSVITGIVSATNRELEGIGGTLIQTDAAINAGNSGGCMLNAKGEIVGISEAKIADEGVEGMCYAIPILENMDLIQQLLSSSEYSEF